MRVVYSLVLAALAGIANAEIIESTNSHFVLRHEASSALSAEDLWERLVEPATWWEPEHTYSGDAKNLSLELEAGGYWREDWDGDSVSHGRVLLVQRGSVLRLDAPFGPLQGMGAHDVWTITISANADGSSTVVFDEVVMAPPSNDLPAMAEAVNAVKSIAISRLAGDASN